MNKRLIIMVTGFLLMIIPAFSTARAASWAKLVYATEASSYTRANFQKAIDVVDKLLTKHKIVLSNQITIVVAPPDEESYIDTLMSYNMYPSRAFAEKMVRAKAQRGCSSLKESLIMVRLIPARSWTPQGTTYAVDNPEDGVFFMPHEVFHQVQTKYFGNVRTAYWLDEGTAMLFEFMAHEAFGLRRVTDTVKISENVIRQAEKIPSARELASWNKKNWMYAGTDSRHYEMVALMTYRLVGDNGFGKVISFYQLLRNGIDQDTAFVQAFGVSMDDFLTDMDDYFNKLRR